MKNPDSLTGAARPPNNFWDTVDDLDLDALDKEYHEMEATEEGIAAREQAEEANRLAEALNADPFQLRPEQTETLSEFERDRETYDHSEQGQAEFLNFLRAQEEAACFTTPAFPWTAPLIIREEPHPIISEPTEVVAATALKEASAAVAPPKAESLPDAGGKKIAISNPTPYAAMDWLIRSLHIVNAGGMLYFYKDGAYLPRRRDDAKRIILDACRSAVEMSGNARFVNQIYELLLLEPKICRDADLQLNLVTLNDCVVDVVTGQTIPHTPELFVTTRLKGSYKKGSNTDCPVFKQFLRSISHGDKALEQRIWQAIGYLLVPDQAGKSFILFQGPPHSGKSVLGNFIRGCFAGDVVSALEINDLGGNFVLSDLVAKKLCVDFDLPADPFNKKSVSKLKKLTGSDLLSSDVKFADRVRFICTAKFLFATNHAVLLPNKDEAFNNRLVVVPFSASVAKENQDFHLPEKLAAERDAIIVQALRHYRQLVDNDYRFAGSFAPNVVLGELGESCLDAIAAFLNSYCEMDEKSWTATSVLYALFVELYGYLCEMNPFSSYLLQMCNAKGSSVKKQRGRLAPSSNPIWGFRGIKIKTGGHLL